MEVAGIVLGGRPIVIEALKAYREACEKFKTCRHYSIEIQAVQKRLRVQNRLFENECFLLLKHIFPTECNSSAFLDGYTVKSEALREEIDDRFEECLGNSYAECCEVVQDIEDGLHDMQHDLQCFVRSEFRERNRAKETARRIRNVVKITFEKSDYLRKIQHLNELRLEFAALRSQIEEMRRRPTSLLGPYTPACNKIPTEYGLIREASSTLHESLTEAWNSSCDEAAHIQHTTILCLDTKVDDSVRLDLAISSTTSEEPMKQRTVFRGPPTWLYVRSSMTKTGQGRRLKRPLMIPDQLVNCLTGSSSQHTETRDDEKATWAHKTSGSAFVAPKTGRSAIPEKSIDGNGGYKRHRSQFVHDITQDMPNTTTTLQRDFRDQEPLEPANQLPFERNLCKCSNICKHFEQQCCTMNGKERYLGYLSSAKAFKHFIYAASQQSITSGGSIQQSPVTLLDFIKDATDDTMTLLDQLKIAQKLAIAVLQFRSTPWLQEQWELQHLALFQTSTGNTETALRTLHLSAHFPRVQKDKGKRVQLSKGSKTPESDELDFEMGKKQRDPELIELEYNSILYGVENTKICSLGIALLQIGFRKPIETLRQQQDLHNVHTARRLAKHGTAHLGPKYKSIAQKCLSCDFRSGSDLENEELQNAVYADVVCGLEDIIRGLGDVSIQDPSKSH